MVFTVHSRPCASIYDGEQSRGVITDEAREKYRERDAASRQVRGTDTAGEGRLSARAKTADKEMSYIQMEQEYHRAASEAQR